MITTKSNPAAFPSSLRQLKTSLVKNRGDVEKKKVFVRQRARRGRAEDAVMLTTRHRWFRTGRRDLRKVWRQADVGQDDAVAVCRCVLCSGMSASQEVQRSVLTPRCAFFSLLSLLQTKEVRSASPARRCTWQVFVLM